MKRFLCLIIPALAACWIAGVTDAAPKEAAKAMSDYQDIVYFADSRPILIRLHVAVDGQPLPAVWEDHVTKVFKYLDANGDGFLDKNEVQRIPSPDVLFGTNFGVAAPTMADLDANGDGKVTRDELAAYFRRIGALPFQVPSGRAQDNNDGFLELFLNEANFDFGDLILDDLEGVISDGQAVIQLSSGGRRNSNSDALNDALFKLLDTNGDGKLSKEELAAAPAVLLKRDKNDDEIITPDEIVPGARGGNDDGNIIFLTFANGRQNNRRPNGPFWLAHPSASKADLARRLQEKYAKSAKKGEAAPTKLSRKNLGLDEATFVKLDVDGNGVLDTEELARFAQRSPDLELNVSLGEKGSVKLVKHGAPLEANVRIGKDGVPMLELDGTRLDLKALAGEKADGAKAAQQEREQYLQAFKAADRDKNGYLDMSEAMRSPLYRNLFKLMDRDGDGMLFEKEVLAYLEAYQGLQASARADCATVGITSEGKGLFELLDTDGDGRLSIRELRNAVKLIAELDRDSDGTISRTEIPRCSQATFRMGPAAGERNQNRGGAFLVSGGDGFGRRAQQPAKPPRGPEWFRKMDRNGDGDVSRREFLGTDEQFRAIDTDGDGLISVEEADAYDKKQRDKK